MRRAFATRFGAAFALLLAFTLAWPAAAATDDQDGIITKSGLTVQNIKRSPDISENVQSLMRRAKGVMIFPNVLKGAFFIGGEGGSGVLMVRNPDGSWSYPAFYTMGSVSFGLQFGGQASEVMLIILTDKGLNAILRDQVKLGGTISAAVGPMGTGAQAGVTTGLGADVVSYSTNQGLFLGAAVDGAVIARREDWNHGYYGQPVTPQQIVLEHVVSNPKADALREQLATFAD
jgi:SH3 domain-containing YSC84-like protein 1